MERILESRLKLVTDKGYITHATSIEYTEARKIRKLISTYVFG